MALQGRPAGIGLKHNNPAAKGRAGEPMAEFANFTPGENLTFEQALEQLDKLVRRMESGELGLEESIAAYRRGAELALYCQDKLAAAEQQIQKLDEQVLKNFVPDEMRGLTS
jgi:exodeoxyribonuclease VII small subunit